MPKHWERLLDVGEWRSLLDEKELAEERYNYLFSLFYAEHRCEVTGCQLPYCFQVTNPDMRFGDGLSVCFWHVPDGIALASSFCHWKPDELTFTRMVPTDAFALQAWVDEKVRERRSK